MCVLILLCVCPHTTICVLILLHMLPHTTICVLILPYMCPHTTTDVSSYYYLSSVLRLLHMCPHTHTTTVRNSVALSSLLNSQSKCCLSSINTQVTYWTTYKFLSSWLMHVRVFMSLMKFLTSWHRAAFCCDKSCSMHCRIAVIFNVLWHIRNPSTLSSLSDLVSGHYFPTAERWHQILTTPL